MPLRRRLDSDLTAALRAAVSLVSQSVLVVMLAAAPTLTALAGVATGQPPRVQTGLPGQAEVLEEEIHVATLPALPATHVIAEAQPLDGVAVALDGRSDAPPTPPPPER